MIILGLSLEAYVINLIIGIPVFFILRWTFRKWIKKEKIRKIVNWISTIIATPIIYIGLNTFGFLYLILIRQSGILIKKRDMNCPMISLKAIF